jgi:hypothetical protein
MDCGLAAERETQTTMPKKQKEPRLNLEETSFGTKAIVATNQGRELNSLPLDSIYAELWKRFLLTSRLQARTRERQKVHSI